MASKSKPMDAQWHPVKSKPSFMDLVKATAKEVSLYAILNLVLFIWQQKELLASSAAVPAMWFCALLGGLSLGKCLARGWEQ